ncbi:outer membrane beta-barrel family protein [Kriegella aquimaris]|uniref:Outer membrane receptor proteins, mostly Fe transport n=1 Tax=Kriegella aquimaris TaxID=192904 RepID=A0A1G9PQH9_9FLAO|nr:outer membrane beta-barrel family protein [Kriegella aquimaris]SDM00741.1 Outer membrane receptor proteins, mostly Fe transport [Kriegella aquimaris]
MHQTNHHLPFIFLLLSTVLFTYGQESITGKVQSETGNPQAYANVLLLKAGDSTFVKGTITENNGSFLLNNIEEGKYMVSVSMIGFKPFVTDTFDFDGSTKKNLNSIILSEGVELDEVTVSSKKNLYVQKIDRMVINVASSILSAGSSALEILERSPGVLVDRQNSAISLVGKSGVVVMLNGKQSYMPASSLVQLLQSMNASNIETIELITTPPANFDAEGNAGFINIVLKEQTDVGLNGSYALSFGVGNGTLTSDNINFNYRKRRVNVFGSYSFLRDAQGQLFKFDRNFINSDEIPVAIATTTVRDPIQRNHSIRTGLDYQICDKAVVGLLLWANDNKWTMDAINKSNETENDIPTSFVELLNTERNQLQHFGSNINLKHNFKDDRYLSFDFDYLKYRIENPTLYTNSFFDGNNNFLREELTQSDKTTPINIKVGKLDYSDQVNDKIKLGLGIKGAFSNFDNDVLVGTFQGQNLVEDPSLTDVSNLEEKILAAYSSIDYEISKKTSLQVGLRYEHTASELNSDKQGIVVDRTFGELFPTAYISHTINDTLGLNFSYSRRITRPTFNDMAPFVIFIDPTTFFAGNPAVQPAISNSVKFDINYKSALLSAQYSVEDGTISRFQSRFDEESERLIFGATNLDQTKTFTLTLGLPITVTNWWKIQNNLIYLNTKIDNTVNGSIFNFEQNTFNINHTQSFTMAKNLTSEININYNSPSIISYTGTGVLEEFYGLNIGIQKKFGERGGTLAFKVNDLLDSMKWTVTNNSPEQNLNTVNTFDFFNRTFLVTYSRNFGNSKLKSSRARGTGAEEEKQRVQ